MSQKQDIHYWKRKARDRQQLLENKEKAMRDQILVLDEYRRDIRQVTRDNEQKDRRIHELESALRNLCILKQRKDKFGRDSYYTRNQPKAWRIAFSLLGITKK